MMTEEDDVRHSQAADVELVGDEDARAVREASNAILQTERVRQLTLDALDSERAFKLRPSTILELNRCAISGLDSYAGNWRPGAVRIGKSDHQPPDAFRVPELVEELCDYVNEYWSERSAIHLCAMVMWRLNWIHPFTDGNGRTARATAYLVLCARSGSWLPASGANTITDQILRNRSPYYAALESADAVYSTENALSAGTVVDMEKLISGMLAEQLTQYFKSVSST